MSSASGGEKKALLVQKLDPLEKSDLPDCRSRRKFKFCLLGLLLFCVLLMYLQSGTDVQLVKPAASTSDNNSKHQRSVWKGRIFCMILTSEKTWMTRRLAVQQTWAPRCDDHCFFYTPSSNHSHLNDPHACPVKTPDGRGNLSRKVFESLNYVRTHFNGNFDWVLKADDDTYVIMENLRAFLSEYNSTENHYFGHRLTNALYEVRRGHLSGGAGYVLSYQALNKLLTNNTCKFIRKGHNEDLNVARCLSLVKIFPENTKDAAGLNRFHSADLIAMISETNDDRRTYNYQKRNYTIIKGEHGILSVNAITFHQIPYRTMYAYDYLIYDLKTK